MTSSLEKKSLRELVFRGATWVVSGYVLGQIIRLVRNLILARLLFPEAFGLMLIVWTILSGLEMLSDAGLGSAILRSSRGDDPNFLKTVWTVQIIRGAILFLASCVISYPISELYNTPDLLYMIPAAGITAFISGFNSTSLFTCRRRMTFGKLTTLELWCEVVGVIAVVGLAYFYPTVWSLIAGAIISRLVLTISSHFFLESIKSQLLLEKAALREIFSFGKWIFLSSAFYFIGAQSDKLIMGMYLSMSDLGAYGIALLLIDAGHALIIKVNHGILFPAYGKVFQQDSTRLSAVFYKARLGIDCLIVIPLSILLVSGGVIIEQLYDMRYRDAGWIFEILCVRLILTSVNSNSEAILIALGHPQYSVAQNVSRTIWIAIGIPFAWNIAGFVGAIWVVALCELPVLVIMWLGLLRHKLLILYNEVRTLVLVVFGIMVGYAINNFTIS